MASFPGQKAGASPTAPTTPSNLIANPLPSGTQVQLQWNPSQDGDVSISYIITRCAGTGCTNFSPIVTTVPNSVNYIDSGLQFATSYSYTIQAIDGSNNLSGVSNIATAVTPPLPQAMASVSTTNTGNRWPVDIWAAQPGTRRAAIIAPVLAPSIPANFTATTISASQINLSWSASTETNVAISLYTVVISPGSITVQISAPTTIYNDTGLTASTTYTYTLSATDIHGNTSATTQTSAQTQSSASTLSYPRVALVASGGDASFGQVATSGFTTYSAAAPGTAAYTAVQAIGAYDLVWGLGGSFEAWPTNAAPVTRNRQDLVNAIKGQGSFTNTKNTARTPYVFIYSNMESAQNLTSGAGYQGFSTQVINNNWWTYETAGGSGTITPSAASGAGFSTVNYTYAWNTAAGVAALDHPICGNVYGSLSNGMGPAQTAAQYFATAFLTTNRTADSRFTGLNTNNAAPNANGVTLDNVFVYPNAGGNLAGTGVSWDGIGTQPNNTVAAYPSGASSLLARGQFHFFQQYQSYLATVNPGSVYLNMGNFGSYANTVGNGNTSTLSANALNLTLHGGLLEAVAGFSGSSWQTFQTAAQVLTNYASGIAFCQTPQFVCVGTVLPATDGSQTAAFMTAGTTQTVTTGTALEYQMMRCMLCLTLMNNGFFGAGVHGYNYGVTRWYDEYGDDSLAQVNVKRGYLGQPSAASVTLSNGVLLRRFANGFVLFNPWNNGAQTVTLAQINAQFAGNFLNIGGTQQATINNGRVFSSITLADADGHISINDTAAALTITTTSLPNATVGTAYSASMAVTGGTTPYIYAITSDTPDTGGWLSINSSTGALTGTPGTAETESVVFQVTDALGRVTTKTLPLVVISASSFTFAPNLPTGYTKIWDRQWDPTDPTISGGVLPPASGTGTDSYGMGWGTGDGQHAAPLINTVANINSALGSITLPVPVTTPPDGHPNVLAIVYPSGYPAAQLPFDVFAGGSVSFKRIYGGFLVWMPSAFNSNGNNIKWLGVGGNSAFNHIFMLSSGATASDGRSAWMTLQGNVNNNMGGSSGTLPSVVSLAVPPPQGSTVGWWTAMRNQWVMVEWLADVVNGFFMSWVTPLGKPTFLVNNFQGVNFGTSVLQASSFIPYYGGGGSSAPQQEAIIVARSCAYGSNA